MAGKIRILLYHVDEYSSLKDDTYRICRSPLDTFDGIVMDEEFPFHDEDSKEMLRQRGVTRIENDRYAIREGDYVMPITFLMKYEKEGLVLIKNSKKGIYTHVTHLDKRMAEVYEGWDDDLLFAVCVDTDNVEDVFRRFTNKEAVNFSIDGDMNNPYDVFEFCRKFEYDWKRDLPQIEEKISYEYDESDVCYINCSGTKCYEAGEIADKRVLAHTVLNYSEFRSRRLAIMLVDYMKDGSVRLDKINSTKNPNLTEILNDLPDCEEAKKTFFLVIDVDETIRESSNIIDYCLFGGWIYKDYIEISDKHQILPLFGCLIPEILEKKMIFMDDIWR